MFPTKLFSPDEIEEVNIIAEMVKSDVWHVRRKLRKSYFIYGSSYERRLEWMKRTDDIKDIIRREPEGH